MEGKLETAGGRETDEAMMDDEETKVKVDIITTLPEVRVVVSVVATPKRSDADDTGPGVIGNVCAVEPIEMAEDRPVVRVGGREAEML